jgi:hypothetical protein
MYGDDVRAFADALYLDQLVPFWQMAASSQRKRINA